MAGSVPILMYHRVASHESLPDASHTYLMEMSTVTPEMFERQIAWLAEHGYESVMLDEVLDHREQQRYLPPRSVVITFDDGYQDCADNAIPILRKYGFRAHIFLVGGQVGKTAQWDRDVYGWDFPLFNWDTVRSLEALGFQFGAHTMSHPRLTELTPDEARYEIAWSRQTIEENLGHTVEHFCYPYGDYNEAVRSIVEETGFRSACSTRRGASPVNDDPLALRRIVVSGWDNMFDFRCRLLGIRPVRQWPRQGVRRIRQRLANLLET